MIIQILSDIERYEIKIYEFPICDDSDDDQFKKIDEDIRVNRFKEILI